MASKDSMVRDLLDKLRDAPPQELSEVVDFVERLRAKRQAAATRANEGPALEARLAQAVAAGVLRASSPGARRFSTVEAPPVQVSGRLASDLVLEDRR